MAQCDCYMSQSQDCVLGHQLSVLRFVLGVQPVRHREDEGLHNVLLMGPHARPERLAKIFNGRVPEFLESDQGGVWLLRLLHLGCHILVAVGNFKKALLFCCRYKLKKIKNRCTEAKKRGVLSHFISKCRTVCVSIKGDPPTRFKIATREGQAQLVDLQVQECVTNTTMTTSQLRVTEVGRRHHDFGRKQPAWESSEGEGCWRQQLSTGFYPLEPLESFYGMQVIMPRIFCWGVIFVV